MGTDASSPPPTLTVAIASRDRVYRDSLSLPLRRCGLRVRDLVLIPNGRPAELDGVDVLVIDSDALSPADLQHITRLHARWPLVEVVAVTVGQPVEEAVEALRAGVFTVLQHPVADELLVATIIQAGTRHHRARTRIEELNRARYNGEHGAGGPPGPAVDMSPEEVS
jgi:DNA-binding NtrC family response regulator